MNLYKKFLNVGAMTLLSRIFGFVRDILMANILGTGIAADAFFAAFRFPNLFRRILAEGVFNAAFIPMFAGELEKNGLEAARILAAKIISWLIVILLIITILAEIFMPQIMALFVPGFVNDKEKFELTILLTRICFPYLAAMSLMSAYGAILNGLGKFLLVAFAPVLLNIVLIIFLIALIFAVETTPQISAIWLSVGVMIGGIAQVSLVIWGLKKTSLMPKFILPKFEKDIKRFWLLAIPVMLSGGVTQINLFIGTIIASSAGGAISILYYADRLYQLPLGLIGIAIGVVLLPELSRHLKGGRKKQAMQVMDQSMLFALLLTMPASAGLIILAEPIISTLFEHGAFTKDATIATANALVAFSFGLPAFVLTKLFQPAFFAREDTKTPTYFAIISVIINIALSLALFPIYKHVGIAIATSIAAWSNVILLSFTLFRRSHFLISNSQIKQYSLIILISLIMALLLFLMSMPLVTILAGNAGFLLQTLSLGFIIIIGVGFYFAATHILKVINLREITKFLKKES